MRWEETSYFRKKGLWRFDQQFLAGGSLRNWIHLFRAYGGVDARYLARALYITTITLASTPFRAYERARFDAQIAAMEIQQPPIFIVGHWRSGTTYVHQLMAQNPAFAIVNFVKTMIPELFLSGWIFRKILEGSLPETRPMDNVRLSLDFVEEEEYALGNLGAYSFYHALSFPRRMREIFDRAVLFKGVADEEITQWQQTYLYYLKKITFASQGRRLLLKNPANTGRISVLLDMFPEAKFVHVCRNPYTVYSSTMHWLDKEMAPTALQNVDKCAIRENVLINYEKLTKKYLEEKGLIPADNLVEVKYEEAEADPWGEIERIYNAFDLSFDEQARAGVARYLASIDDYQKNVYQLDAVALREITEAWGFAARLWAYDPPPAQ